MKLKSLEDAVFIFRRLRRECNYGAGRALLYRAEKSLLGQIEAEARRILLTEREPRPKWWQGIARSVGISGDNMTRNRYIIVKHDSLDQLAVEVGGLLDESPVYEPAGGPFIDGHEWCQALFWKERGD